MGPFERDAMAGLPGFDAATLVCAGDVAGASEGQWSPAADVPELAPLALAHGAAWSPDAPDSSFDLLDKLQIESAGLIGDDQYPSAAEVLFQDAELKKSFAELLVSRTSADDTEVRRLRGLVSDLSVQLELMYRRIAQLENTRADFLGKPSQPDAAVRPSEPPPSAAPVVSPAAAGAPTPASSPFPTFPPASIREPEPPSAVPTLAPSAAVTSAAASQPGELPNEAQWPVVASAGGIPSLSLLKGPEIAPSAATSIPDIPILKTTPESVPTAAAETPLPPMPDIPSLSPTLESAPAENELAPLPPLPFLETPSTPTPEAPASVSAAAAAIPIIEETAPSQPPPVRAPDSTPAPTSSSTRRMIFDKPKTLRIVPTMRALRVVGPADAAVETARVEPEPQPSSPQVPAESVSLPAFTPPAPAPVPAPMPSPLPPMSKLSVVETHSPAPLPVPEPVLSALPTPAEVVPPPVFAPVSVPAPALSTPSPAAFPSSGAFPADSFPHTGSIPAASSASGPSSPVVAEIPPSTAIFSATPAFGSGIEAPSSPPTQAVLARLAKPAAAPPTAPAPKPRGGSKTFMILGGIMVVVLVILGVAFLRHGRELKQMAALDDGKPPVGAEPVDDASRPALPKTSASAAGAVPGGISPVAPAASSVPAAPVGSVVPAAPSAPAVPVAPVGSQASPMTAQPPVAAEAAPTAAPAVSAAPAPGPGDAAVAFVMDFPLDGGRGTVEKWLQFSYSATPDAGREVWTATEQSDGTSLVEYRFVPNVEGAPGILYLFVADPARGYVQGKNRDARDMLSGGGPRVSAKDGRAATKKRLKNNKSAPRRAPHRATSSVNVVPAEPAQLPLPSEGELRTHAEADGDFGSDTVKAGP